MPPRAKSKTSTSTEKSTSTDSGPIAPSEDATVSSVAVAPVAPAGPLDPPDLEPPDQAEHADSVAPVGPAGGDQPAGPLDPPDLNLPSGSPGVLDTAAAPLAPPPGPDPLPEPPPPDPVPDVEHLGFVDDAGQPVRIADVFDMSGTALVLAAKRRVHRRFRMPGVRTVLQTLLYAEGMEERRAVVESLIAREAAGQ